MEIEEGGAVEVGAGVPTYAKVLVGGKAVPCVVRFSKNDVVVCVSLMC